MKLGEAVYKNQQKDAEKKDAKQSQDSKISWLSFMREIDTA